MALPALYFQGLHFINHETEKGTKNITHHSLIVRKEKEKSTYHYLTQGTIS
jgi:hypothetical protein